MGNDLLLNIVHVRRDSPPDWAFMNDEMDDD